MPAEQTNWYSNPNRPSGPDWAAGYVPDAYRYLYGDPQHATGPEDPMARRAAGAYRLYLEDPLLQWLGKMRDGR